MLYLATISFSGNQISMAKGRVCEITDSALIADLTKAGYIIPYEATDKKEDTTDKPKTKQRKGKKDED